MGSGKTILAVAEAYRLAHATAGSRCGSCSSSIGATSASRPATSSATTSRPTTAASSASCSTSSCSRSNHIDPAANVVISTIQRLYSILRGEEEFDPELEDESVFEHAGERGLRAAAGQLPTRRSRSRLFDFIFTDEGHRSIYGRWGQVLDYFDAFLVGLTATPSKFTYGYFQGNVVAPYTYEESVIDGVNVDYTTYRIETEVSKQGATVGKGEWVRSAKTDPRAGLQGARRRATYDEAKLDRAVVAEDQIRTVDPHLPRQGPDRDLPRPQGGPEDGLLLQARHHAEDVLRIVREEFGRGSDFARKITYKTQGSSRAAHPGLPHRPEVPDRRHGRSDRDRHRHQAVECLVFLRMVQSRAYFEQMKGRGVRKIDDDEFWAVTPGAGSRASIKDHFVIVDCVGLTDEDKAWVETSRWTASRTCSLKSLLAGRQAGDDRRRSAGHGRGPADPPRRQADAEDEAEIAELAGASLKEIAEALVAAIDPDQRSTRSPAEELDEERDPTEEEIAAAKEQLVEAAVEPLPEGRGPREAPEPADPDRADHRHRHAGQLLVGRLRRRRRGRGPGRDLRGLDQGAPRRVRRSRRPTSRGPTSSGRRWRTSRSWPRRSRRRRCNLTPERLWKAYKQLDERQGPRRRRQDSWPTSSR